MSILKIIWYSKHFWYEESIFVNQIALDYITFLLLNVSLFLSDMKQMIEY